VIAVGAPLDNEATVGINGPSTGTTVAQVGAVTVFKFDPVSNQYLIDATIKPSVLLAGGNFGSGTGLSQDGATLIVGWPKTQAANPGAGAVVIYSTSTPVPVTTTVAAGQALYYSGNAVLNTPLLLPVGATLSVAGNLSITQGIVLGTGSKLIVGQNLVITAGAPLTVTVAGSGTVVAATYATVSGQFDLQPAIVTTSGQCVSSQQANYGASTLTVTVVTGSCSTGLSTGALVGIIVGSVVGGCLVVLLIVLVTIHMRRRYDIAANQGFRNQSLRDLASHS
jgi:hypothetical protein